jgi:hypothetical protein
MKIGFSFGRCLRDIVTGEVEYDDVLVLITRTHMAQVEHIADVVDQYLDVRHYLGGLDAEDCHKTAIKLWNDGKLHQPRMYGQSYASRPEGLIWMDLFPSVTKDVNPMVQEAWENYRMTLSLAHSNSLPTGDTDEHVYKR